MHFLETSAKTAKNIHELFYEIGNYKSMNFVFVTLIAYTLVQNHVYLSHELVRWQFKNWINFHQRLRV